MVLAIKQCQQCGTSSRCILILPSLRFGQARARRLFKAALEMPFQLLGSLQGGELGTRRVQLQPSIDKLKAVGAQALPQTISDAVPKGQMPG